MKREEALSRILPHEAELRASGLAALYLFGSTARDEAAPRSDIDLMCDLDPARALGLIEFAGLKLRLEAAVAAPVDLVPRRSMRPAIRARAESDMIQVF